MNRGCLYRQVLRSNSNCTQSRLLFKDFKSLLSLPSTRPSKRAKLQPTIRARSVSRSAQVSKTSYISLQKKARYMLCSSQETQRRQNATYSTQNAPGYTSSSAPPPPPPPPPPQKTSRFRPNRWGIAALLIAGAALWWAYLDSQIPDIYRDKENGLQYITTKGGNKVIIGEDSEGRVYFIDAAGNFYYDTGTKDLGFYVVTKDNEIFNVFEETPGERETVYVGRLEDLRTQDIRQLGGIPVDQMEKAFGKSFDGTITGFVDPVKNGQLPEKSLDPSSKELPAEVVTIEAEE